MGILVMLDMVGMVVLYAQWVSLLCSVFWVSLLCNVG